MDKEKNEIKTDSTVKQPDSLIKPEKTAESTITQSEGQTKPENGAGNDEKKSKSEKYSKLRKDIYWYYFALVFFMLPLFFIHMYFNISMDKWLFFAITSLVALFLIACSNIIDPAFSFSPRKLISGFGFTEYAILAFLLFNIISFLASVDKKESFTGPASRHHGFLSIVIYCLVLLMCRRQMIKYRSLIEILAISALLVNISAISQYLSFDPLGLYSGVTAESVHRMISTIGNMNIFASFLCMTAALTLWLFATADTTKKLLGYGFCSSLFVPAAIAGNSDSFYLGLFAGVAFLIICGALKGREVARLFLAGAPASAFGFIFLKAADYVEKNKIILSASLKETGISIRPAFGIAARLREHPEYMLFSLAFFLVIGLLLYFIFKGEKGEKRLPGSVSGKLIILYCICCIIALVVLAAAYPYENEMASYRGFIWNLTIEDFKNAPLLRKLFGYGQETVMGRYFELYYDQMKSVTGVIYDNAHCEPLQYLNTTGVFGLLSYLAVVFSLFTRMAKKIKQTPEICMLLVPALAYFIQSFVNIAQSATTPIFFLILALGLAALSSEEKQ